MSFNQNEAFHYASSADSWLDLDDMHGEIKIANLISPLIKSITKDGDVSYIIGKQRRYRSSTLATVLDALYNVNLLPSSAVKQMQNRLFELKTDFTPQNSEDDKIEKYSEDFHAWGIDETPSVWTTSMVIIALINTHFTKRDNISSNQKRSLRESVYWLASQSYPDGGWGYQKFDSLACSSSIPMTALAMKAIILAHNDSVLFNDYNKKNPKFQTIVSALEKGKDYILHNIKKEDNKAFWEYKNEPGVAISIWTLDALKLLSESNIGGYYKQEYEELEPKVIDFAFSKIIDANGEYVDSFKSELFFAAGGENGGIKYKNLEDKSKNFYTFTPYIVSSLLDRCHIKASDKRIVATVKWLLKNRESHWKIENYNSSSPCSISSAMAINVIVKWLKQINNNTFVSVVDSLINNRNSSECEYGLSCTKENINTNECMITCEVSFAQKHSTSFIVVGCVSLLIFFVANLVIPESDALSHLRFAGLLLLITGILNNKFINKILAKQESTLKNTIVVETVSIIINYILTYFSKLLMQFFSAITKK